MNRPSWWLASILSLVTTIGVGAEPDLAKLMEQRRDAARKTFEITWANYRDGRAPADLLYRWSKRWLEAEKELSARPDDRIAACKAHWERMTELERLVRALRETRQATVDEVSGSEFYRIEAEVWLQQAKQMKKAP